MSSKAKATSVGYQLSDEPTHLIGADPEYQHTAQDEDSLKPSALLPLLEDMDSYLKNTSQTILDEDLQRDLNSKADDIVAQLLKDNSQELNYTYRVIDTTNAILDTPRFDIAKLVPDTTNLITAIRDIMIQYNALIDYIPIYIEAYNYTPTNDDPAHITYYHNYTDRAVEDYIYKLLDATKSIDLIAGNLARRGLYNLLLTADASLIEPNTQIQHYVEIVQAVQNNRLYRGRETMIIALNEAISVSNLIRLMWLLIQINYDILRLQNKDNSDLYEQLKNLIDEFNKTRDPSLLDKIADLIKQIEDELKNKANESVNVSQIAQNVSAIGKLKDKSSIQRYIETLDGFIAKINAINITLSTFDYTLDYSGLQAVLNKLSILQTILNNLLGDSSLSEYFNKANEIIRAINRTADAIRSVGCLIKQAMCLAASTINFTNTIVAPAIKNIQNTIKGLSDDVDTTIDNFARDTLAPFNDAVKLFVYEQARASLKGKGYELATAINKTDDTFTTQYNAIVDNVIDSALGNPTSAITYLKDTSSKMIGDIASNFKVDGRQATNCPPLQIKGSLRIPDLSLQSNLPTLNSVKLDVKC